MKTINGRSYPTYDEIKDAQRQLAADCNCSRDHCTPEERAVIEAAIRFRETSIALHAYFDSNEPDTEGLGVYPLAEASEAAGKSFKIACEALLTARAGKETG